MNEDELFEIASRYREAIEQSDLSEESIDSEAASRLRAFPDSSCAEVSEILGIFLKEKFNLDPLKGKGGQIEKGEKWWGSHEWLQHNDIIIDITADQFDLVDDIIVSSDSKFHNEYANEIYDASDTFELSQITYYLKKLYEIVTAKYFELENSGNSE